MGLYFLLAPPMSSVDRRARTGPLGLTLIVAALGFYDGFFGPGTGSFLTLTLVALGGLGLVRSIGNPKFLNLPTNIAGLLAMIVGGTGLLLLIIGPTLRWDRTGQGVLIKMGGGT